MANEARQYTKSFDDELDWKTFDQLHGAVSQISNFCFETKKFCVTTVFVVLTVLMKFTADRIDHSLFVTGLVILICFWFLDSIGYYYQVKLRATMETIRLRLVKRNTQSLVIPDGTPIISSDRMNLALIRRVFRSAINNSMWLYALAVSIDLMLWAMYYRGMFQ